MSKVQKDPKFKVEVIETHEGYFVYKRDGQRDRWICYNTDVLPDTLEVVVGKSYTGQNIITTENGTFVSWKREFKAR